VVCTSSHSTHCINLQCTALHHRGTAPHCKPHELQQQASLTHVHACTILQAGLIMRHDEPVAQGSVLQSGHAYLLRQRARDTAPFVCFY
jgi:hypothetical protein